MQRLILQPDDPKFSSEMAHNMINAMRYIAIESLERLLNTMPEQISVYEIDKMKEMTNQKFVQEFKTMIWEESIGKQICLLLC